MKFRYYIDPATDLPHIYGHEVSESEVEVVLSRQEKTGPVGTERGSRQCNFNLRFTDLVTIDVRQVGGGIDVVPELHDWRTANKKKDNRVAGPN